MTATEYKSIRGEKDVLYRYFSKESKIKLNPNDFRNSLQMWLSLAVGVHPIQGQEIILNFLDKKFGYVKQNN